MSRIISILPKKSSAEPADPRLNEALYRLNSLHFNGTAVDDFGQYGAPWISIPKSGIYRTAGTTLEQVRQFELKFDAVVYLVVQSCTSCTTLDSYLYVSDYEKNWKQERAELEQLNPCVYTYNNLMPQLSHFHKIFIRRTADQAVARSAIKIG